MRAAYWQYLSGPFGEGPTLGLSPATTNKHLALGICWHIAAEELLKHQPAAEASRKALVEAEKYSELGEVEKNWLLAAPLAWERSKAEEFFAEWEVLSIEDQMETALSPNVILQSRADAVIQRRVDGTIWVLNWKTTGKALKDFNAKFRLDIQSWTEALAVEANLGLPVAGTIYYGVWKGPVWNGNMTSRLIYGYKEWLPSGAVTYTPEYKGGRKRFEVWNESFPFGEGITAWINWLPVDFLASHFTMAPPALRNDYLVEKWLRQVVRREADIDNILESGSEDDIMDYFEQSWSEACDKCPYLNLCLERSDPDTLMREGLLVPRKDHHERLPKPEGE
jgi:hypothetical protein